MRFPVPVPGRLSDDDPTNPADDLSEEVPRRKPRRRSPSQFHRLDDPIETWTTLHVVKEFQIRCNAAFPHHLYPVDGRTMDGALRKIEKAKGITVAQMLSAMETFFAEETHRVPNDTTPMGYYLKHLERWIKEQHDRTPAVDLDFIRRFNAGGPL